MSDKKRLLNDLRVIDLRAELEKRNLDKSGVRGVLIQRLSKHLEEEGLDPTTYKFELANADAKTPSKKTRRSESTVEQEADDTPAMEDMIVQDDAGDEDESEQKENKAETTEAKMEVDETEKTARKRELHDDSEASEPKKACLDKEAKEEDQKTDNNDAEDSINLDLGEDELLNEETDNTTKPIKKDEAANGDAETQSDAAARVDAAPAGDAAPPAASHASADQPATSNDADENDQEQKDDKDKEGEGDKKDRKDESKEGGARNLWVSGLSGDTRAKDLKQLCSKHGKVIGAKVVTNAKTPGSRCYGYVTMASSQDAENCIKNLHRTELHGRMISVEKAKSESESSSRRQPSRSDHGKDCKEETKEESKDGAEKTGDGKPSESGGEGTRSTSRTREKSDRSDKDRTKRSTRSRERRRSPPRDVLSFNKIWKERDVARARERSRAAREEERRRRAAEEALRERERRQRQEKHRLALEREKLRAEREKIEREKNELLRLERERHRLEREKLELERMELKRAQLRLEDERRKRGYESSSYRKAASPPPDPAYERDARHKRPPPPPIASTRQFEAPPPPRFEMSSNYDRSTDKRDRGTERDYKRSEYPRHVSSSRIAMDKIVYASFGSGYGSTCSIQPAANIKYSSNGATDDARQPMPPGTRPKEPSRTYDSRDTRSYRPSPPTKPEPRSWNTSSRYPDSSVPSKGSSSNAAGETWSSSGGGGGGSSDTRYAGYDTRYPPQYQPPPPGATYPDRYAQPARESYTRKY